MASTDLLDYAGLGYYDGKIKNWTVSDAAVTATGSSAGRTLPARFADIVNVKDFGAVGDGVTDDTAAIQTAAASANGRPLLLPDTYLVSSLVLPSGTKISGEARFIDAGTGVSDSYVVVVGENSCIDSLSIKMKDNNAWRFGVEVKAGCRIENLFIDGGESRFNGEAMHLHGNNIYVGFLRTQMINRGGTVGAYECINTATGYDSNGSSHYKNITLGGYFLDGMVQGLRIGRASFCNIGKGTVIGLPESVSRTPSTGNNAIYITASDNISIGDVYIDLALEHAVRIGGDDKGSTVAFQTHHISFGVIYSRRHGGSAFKISPAINERAYYISVNSIYSIDAGIRDRENTRRLSTLRLSHCDNFDCGDVVSHYTDPSIEPAQPELYETDVVEINNSTNIDINAVSADTCGRSVVSFNEENDVDDGTDYSTLHCENIDIHAITCKKSFSGSFSAVKIYTTGMTVDDVLLQNVYMYGTDFQSYINGSDKTNLTNFFLSVYDRSGKAATASQDGSNIIVSSVSSKGGANIVSSNKAFDKNNPINTASLFVEGFNNSSSTNYSDNAIVLSRVDSFSNPSGGIAAYKSNVSRNCGLSLLCGTGESDGGKLKDGWILFGSTDTIYLYPAVDSASSTNKLGDASKRISEIYCANSTINTSDRREKDNVSEPSEQLFRAWGKVRVKLFQFKDALAKKGSAARIHSGMIAQEVAEAFASEGLDAATYGLFCHDEWEESTENIRIVDKPAVLDSDGKIIEEELSHTEIRVVPAGDRYGIRYTEALALECAYQRWLGEKRDARIAALEEKLNG